MRRTHREHRIVTLASGGTITITLELSASVGLMKMAKPDRDFVAGIIDRVDDYESAFADARAGEVEATS